ncbi:hypothetical protein PR202_ga30335 [Eleusine coracana subsp. coracana]|uniref:GH18 domain-containing protein n=1 Tax=Eleusine coracana subsp. coracana TaxID=191504 RepID=A0AAV5DM11_ELECO|nr:hypothetical protein PR202_ga30335 [Eleusine coracana subsp. coracana]
MALTSWKAPMMMLVLATIMIGFLTAPASAVLENKTGQVTVFWGRNKNEGSLREACDSGRYTMVIMSFLDVYGHGKYHLDLSGHPLGRIGADIKHCQYKAGFPDRFFIKKALDTGIFERIHVRFYDDPDCAVFWQQEWEKWTTAYPYTKIYFGLPASPEAAKGGQGYVHPKNVYYGILPVAQTAANYGGVMIWNRYYDKLSDFSSYIDQWA